MGFAFLLQLNTVEDQGFPLLGLEKKVCYFSCEPGHRVFSLGMGR
jgi:hypothetical protein